MKCFTWNSGKITTGLEKISDEKIGNIVFLGEDGRGRHYQKVGLSRHNPPEVTAERIVDAFPKTISLPPKDGKPEKNFLVLEKPKSESNNFLIRINTLSGYEKGAFGSFKTITGSPQLLTSGNGAFGDAGRVGSWIDSLIILHPGDVIKIKPTLNWGKGGFALWVNEEFKPQTAPWDQYEILMATINARKNPDSFKLKGEGEMECYSFEGGIIKPGICLQEGFTGPALLLGERGRGRASKEIPTLDSQEIGCLRKIAVAEIADETYALVRSNIQNKSSFLVHIQTKQGYTRRGDGTSKTWKGQPVLISQGRGADGDAGGIGTWGDELYIVTEGDVIFVSPSGDGSEYAIFVRNGAVQCEEWVSWKMEDGEKDPDFYIKTGIAPINNVPNEWLGKVVDVIKLRYRAMSGGKEVPCFARDETGELISMEPLVLNLGWDARDYYERKVSEAVWIRLTENNVTRLEGTALIKRKELLFVIDSIQKTADEVVNKSYFRLTDESIKNKIYELRQDPEFKIMPSEGAGSLESWISSAKETLEKFSEIEPGIQALTQRQDSGEILADFGGHFREMGATNNVQFWVITPNGSEREPDTITFRKRYTTEGDKIWKIVASEEIAISWSKSYTGAEHTFRINKMPDSGPTKEQKETIKRIEQEIAKRFDGSTGMSGTISPPVGEGWNL